VTFEGYDGTTYYMYVVDDNLFQALDTTYEDVAANNGILPSAL
jgi:hypothetical protein